MTRTITLTLADDTTETECGACSHIGEPRGHWCSIWGALQPGRRRTDACRAAERESADARLGRAVREALDYCFAPGCRSDTLGYIADALDADDVYHSHDAASDLAPMLRAISSALREEVDHG